MKTEQEPPKEEQDLAMSHMFAYNAKSELSGTGLLLLQEYIESLS